MCFDHHPNGRQAEPATTYVTCKSAYEAHAAATFENYVASLEDTLAANIRLYEVHVASVARQLASWLGAREPIVDNFTHGY